MDAFYPFFIFLVNSLSQLSFASSFALELSFFFSCLLCNSLTYGNSYCIEPTTPSTGVGSNLINTE